MTSITERPIGGKPPWYYDKDSSKKKYVKPKKKKAKVKKTRHISKKI
jgi:hypothetical protein